MMPDSSSRINYPEPLATRWLVWLARNLNSHGKTIFMIEELQPSWLEHRWQRLANLVLFSLLFGFVLSWIFVMAWIASKNLDPPNHALIRWWVWWLGTSLCFLLVAGLEVVTARWLRREGRDPWHVAFGKTVAKAGIWLVAWYAIWTGFTWAYLVEESQRSHWLEIGVIVAFIVAARLNRPRFIETVEALGWSWRLAAKGLLSGLAAGVVVWIGYAYAQGWGAGEMSWSQIMMNLWLYIPIGGVGGAFLMGLRYRLLDTKTVPNQGMLLSLRNALLASLSGPLMGLFCWPILILHVERLNKELAKKDPSPELEQLASMGCVETLGWSLVMGAVFGCIALLWFGGFDLLKHYTLRLVSSLTRQAPANFVRFFDHAVDDLNFLQRVGGGYMFIHRFLAEHFADGRRVPED